MKGLLIKDCIVLWKQMKLMLFIMLLYLVIGAVNMENLFWVCVAVLFLFNLIYTAAALDERCRWDRYSVMLPCSRKEIVLEKYVLGLLGTTGATLLYAGLMFLMQNVRGSAVTPVGSVPGNVPPVLLICVMSFSMSFLLFGVNIPLMFKFGAEKGKLWSIISAGIIFAAFFFLMGGFGGEGRISILLLDGVSAGSLAAISAGSIGLLLLSVFLSFRIYEKKEI